MIDFSDFFHAIRATPLLHHQKQLQRSIDARFKNMPHGHLKDWLADLNLFPELPVSSYSLASDVVTLESPEKPQQLDELLSRFHPWRKGPFSLFDVFLDCEWRSDWKWQRLIPHIRSLNGARVLDVGCGNGYHCWRMRGAGAELVVGVDPTLLYLMQFLIVKRYLGAEPVFLLPLKCEELPGNMPCFDSVFSMGVLYHRRSPMDHLHELWHFLKPGGELILETLVIPDGDCLEPGNRYASMRNVWAIPGVQLLEKWVHDAGFTRTRIVDVTTTTFAEQRSTRWMKFQSLKDFLNPDDPTTTIEGHPAPLRAIVIAEKPGG